MPQNLQRLLPDTRRAAPDQDRVFCVLWRVFGDRPGERQPEINRHGVEDGHEIVAEGDGGLGREA